MGATRREKASGGELAPDVAIWNPGPLAGRIHLCCLVRTWLPSQGRLTILLYCWREYLNHA
jgi:hypothetical protein